MTDPEPCTTCGTPLDAVQRYCLNCGTRRGGERVDVLDALSSEGVFGARPAEGMLGAAAPDAERALGPAAGGPGAHAPGLNAWLRANTPTLGLGGLLLATLLVGLLVGHWATPSSDAPAVRAQGPQIIHVAGAPAPATTTAAATAVTGPTPGAGAKKKTKKTTTTATTAKTPTKAVAVTSLDTKAVQKAVKKGEPISTGGGTPPPKDDKAAGGGTSFDTIG